MSANGSHALWLEVVNRIIGEGPRASLLDLCCGGCAVTRHLNFGYKVGVDVEDHPERPTGMTFVKEDVWRYLDGAWDLRGSFDVSIISDGLEHFTKSKGMIVRCAMRRVSNLSIIFVPTGDEVLVTPDSLDPHSHKSSWTAEELKKMGYTVEEFPEWHGEGRGALFAWIKEGA